MAPYSGDMLAIVARSATVSSLSLAEEFDEFAHDFFFPQEFRDAEGEIGSGDPFGHFSIEMDADHFGSLKRDGLAQHGSFSFDPADAPAHYAEAVDHRRMGIGADKRVEIENLDLFQ